MHFFQHPSITSSVLDPNIFLSNQFSNTFSIFSRLNVNTMFCIFQFLIVLDSKGVGKTLWTKWHQTFPRFNLLLISLFMQFLFVRVIPNYLKCPTLLNNLLSFVLHSVENTWKYMHNYLKCPTLLNNLLSFVLHSVENTWKYMHNFIVT